MNVLLTQTILAAHGSDGDETIWVQILVLVIVAASFAIFSLVNAKAHKLKGHNQHPSQNHKHQIKPGFGAHRLSFSAPAAGRSLDKRKPVSKVFEGPGREREKDLHSGMELLGQDFLLKVIENANGDSDEKDVTMRKLNFKELSRRGKLDQIDSKALREYAVNKGNLYGKDIQFEAMKALAERTAKGKTGN
ncbi:MAG: hypothetical protein PHY02_08030 [Phycisphaerae bacterium]|nr:hypothetical protein [Phycisphaerae bacterium]